jgi:hypothetical protein
MLNKLTNEPNVQDAAVQPRDKKSASRSSLTRVVLSPYCGADASQKRSDFGRMNQKRSDFGRISVG